MQCIRDLSAGDEVLISYVDATRPWWIRQPSLWPHGTLESLDSGCFCKPLLNCLQESVFTTGRQHMASFVIATCVGRSVLGSVGCL